MNQKTKRPVKQRRYVDWTDPTPKPPGRRRRRVWILVVLAVLLVGAGGLGYLHSHHRSQRAICEVINLYVNLARINQYATFVDLSYNASLHSGAVQIAECVQTVRAADMSRCPPDFRDAMVRHLDCQVAKSQVLLRHPAIPEALEGKIDDCIRQTFSVPSACSNIPPELAGWITQATGWNARIESTWQDVDALMTHYGIFWTNITVEIDDTHPDQPLK